MSKSDPAEFNARYGFTIQEYVNRCAVDMLRAPKLDAERLELVGQKAALAALGDQNAINAGSDTRKIQDLADAVNAVKATEEIIRNSSTRQKFAKQFAAGEIGWDSFRSYFGTYPQELIDEGSVNPDEVLAAVQAAAGIES